MYNEDDCRATSTILENLRELMKWKVVL
jgi:predicted RecB family nuclease